MSGLLLSLVILACPVVMGLMMWMMMRGGNSQTAQQSQPQSDEIVRLRAEVDQLRAETADRVADRERTPDCPS